MREIIRVIIITLMEYTAIYSIYGTQDTPHGITFVFATSE